MTKIIDVTVSTEIGKFGINIQTEDKDLFAPSNELSELNENAAMYLNDPYYYAGELRELAEEWIGSDYNYVYPFGETQGFVKPIKQK